MWNRFADLIVLAQEAGGAAAAPAADPAGAAPNGAASGNQLLQFMMPIVIFGGVMLYMSMRSQKRDQQRRLDMIRSLKKNDPVVTIGGIIGTVVTVSEDGSEVTVKMVDDTRIKFRADAIRDVTVKSEPAPEKT
jgi:preprotein translocase subunit YajC